MLHHEALYVLFRAHTIRRFIADAEAKGEHFHVMEHFSPLENGLQAQAQIRKIHPEDLAPSLILRLRHRPGLPDAYALCTRSALGFFDKIYSSVPGTVEADGWVERLYVSPDVPEIKPPLG